MYDGQNNTGNRICFSGAGTANLGDYCDKPITICSPIGGCHYFGCWSWNSNVRSFWPGSEAGTLNASTGTQPFPAWGPSTNVDSIGQQATSVTLMDQPWTNVRATETQEIKPYVCLDGVGFTPGNIVTIEYDDIPGRTAPVSGGTVAVQSNGAITFGPDLGWPGISTCNSTQLSGNVTLKATETNSQNQVVSTTNATMPADFWCGNSYPGTLNGGCP
jgi:hypothetical protein